MLVSIVFDYAKVRAVVEDRRSMIGAVAAGGRFARRNATAVAALYVLTGSLFVGLLLVYAIASPGARSTGAGAWVGAAIGQLYLLGRLWVRLYSSQPKPRSFRAVWRTPGTSRTGRRSSEPPIVENALDSSCQPVNTG